MNEQAKNIPKRLEIFNGSILLTPICVVLIFLCIFAISFWMKNWIIPDSRIRIIIRLTGIRMGSFFLKMIPASKDLKHSLKM